MAYYGERVGRCILFSSHCRGSSCSLLESLLQMDDMRAKLLEETSLLSIGRLKVASSQCLAVVSVYNQAYDRMKFFTAPWLALADDTTIYICMCQADKKCALCELCEQTETELNQRSSSEQAISSRVFEQS